METMKDSSYGIIPVLKEGTQWKVFLIHQYGSAGDVYWTFPKGHKEEGETSHQAALRELLEETGITPHMVFTEREYVQSYTFKYEDMLIEKEVIYYLGVVADEAYVIQEDEVQEAGWFTFEDAYTKLSFEHARTMLREVYEDLEKKDV